MNLGSLISEPLAQLFIFLEIELICDTMSRKQLTPARQEWENSRFRKEPNAPLNEREKTLANTFRMGENLVDFCGKQKIGPFVVEGGELGRLVYTPNSLLRRK